MKIPRKPIPFIWFILKQNSVLAFCALVAVIFAQSVDSGLYLILKRLTDAVATHQPFAFWAIAYPLAYYLSENIWRISGIFGMRLITRSDANVSKELFSYLLSHSTSYFNSRFAGALVNKIGHAATGVHHVVSNTLWQFIPLLVQLGVNLVLVFFISPYLGLIMIVWVAIFLGFNIWMVRRKQHLSYEGAVAMSVMKGKMVDSVSNIAVVHASGHAEFEREFVGGFIDESQQKALKSWKASEWILFANGTLLAIFTFLMVGFTLLLIRDGSTSLGSLVLMITMTISLQSSLFFIGSKMTDTIDDYSQIEEGLGELITPYDITDLPYAQLLAEPAGQVSFKNVFFSFENKPVFDDFSLEIAGGQKVGLVGVSGAGKSTLVNLLLRNYNVEKGSIALDGHDIAELTRKNLRSHIAFVPQDVSLFHRTIRENIRYGRLNATDAEVEEAARRAQAHEFIVELPRKYETFVGERGVKLSGGQRQRVAIARAFLKLAPILVLDEATSSLDSESEMFVQRALEELMHGRTVLAIAHRLSTLRTMDRIVVLDKGRIVEDGTHDELVARGGHYAMLWNHQVEGFIGE